MACARNARQTYPFDGLTVGGATTRKHESEGAARPTAPEQTRVERRDVAPVNGFSEHESPATAQKQVDAAVVDGATGAFFPDALKLAADVLGAAVQVAKEGDVYLAEHPSRAESAVVCADEGDELAPEPT